MTWIDSTGYPMILMSESHAKKWTGMYAVESRTHGQLIEVEDNNPILSDAAKATAVIDNKDIDVGIFDYFDEQIPAFSLWEDPCTYSTIQYVQQELCIIRFHCGHDFEEALEFIKTTPFARMNDWQDDGLIAIKGGLYHYFDASIAGFNHFDLYEDEVLSIDIPKGNYRIRSCRFCPNEDYILIVHRFEKVLFK